MLIGESKGSSGTDRLRQLACRATIVPWVCWSASERQERHGVMYLAMEIIAEAQGAKNCAKRVGERHRLVLLLHKTGDAIG